MESSGFRSLRAVACFAILVIFSLGCGEAESGDSEKRSKPTIQAHNFDSLVQLKFVASTPNGPVEVRSEEELKEV